MIEGLVAGRVWSSAERRVDKAGRPYCVAKLRVLGADSEGVLVVGADSKLSHRAD